MRDTIDMAREAGIYHAFDSEGHWDGLTDVKLINRNSHPDDIVYGEKRIVEILKAFEALVRADEREQIAQMIEDAPPLVEFVQNDQGGCMMCGFTPKLAAKTIRARGETK